MDLKQLEYFQSIYEEGSISKAAEKLYISQQGLSKAILALEKELDCKLFERNPKGVVLTKAGEALVVPAAELLEKKNDIIKKMNRFREHESLSIDMVIGSRFSIPKGFFKEFLESHPKVDLCLNELENEMCIYNLEHGKADLAITIQPERKEGYLYELIKREPITVVMPSDHFLAEKKKLSLSDINQQCIVVHHMGSSSEVVMEQCKQKGIHFSHVIEVPGMLALYQTCWNLGVLGISLGSLEGKMSFQNLVTVPVCEEEVAWEITLMYEESTGRQKTAKEFIDYLRERLG